MTVIYIQKKKCSKKSGKQINNLEKGCILLLIELTNFQKRLNYHPYWHSENCHR